ncbi:MAG: hypothetical protein Q4A52_07315 [Bacillota bacterium]|nr:hypothetical protein [Bacillota bacterium]
MKPRETMGSAIRKSGQKGKWFSLFVVAALVVFAFIMVDRIGANGEHESIERIEDAIRKAAVTCYAIEGSYPPLAYLVEHYGVVLREDRFYYHYEMVASNILPSIRVIPRWN